MIIPLEIAHKILATFGIINPSREYERWVKDEGFDMNDFASVLCESPYVFVLDWRGCLAEELERMAVALTNLGVTMQTNSADEGDTASVAIDGRSVELSYSPNNGQTSWLAVISALQSIVPATIEFRESINNGESDTDVYSVLSSDKWHDLDTSAAEAIRCLFQPLGTTDG